MRIETLSVASIPEEWDQRADEIGATSFARPGWRVKDCRAGGVSALLL
jgi:hypothetical protein